LLRLKSATEFERVRRDGRSHAHPLVILVARRREPGELVMPGPSHAPGAAPDDRPRFGFLAGKAVGSAVARNRAKRLLREAARGFELAIGPDWDLLLIARRGLAAVRQPAAQAALGSLLQRAYVLRDP
jgi:ribonuclease P protein component